jgi:hypothetical protein
MLFGCADINYLQQAKKPTVLRKHPAMQPRGQHRALIGRSTRHFWRHENKTMDLLIKCRSALSRGSTRGTHPPLLISTWPQQQRVLTQRAVRTSPVSVLQGSLSTRRSYRIVEKVRTWQPGNERRIMRYVPIVRYSHQATVSLSPGSRDPQRRRG